MKKLIIRWVLPIVMNLLVEGLKSLVSNTNNSIDDEVVAVVDNNKAAITAEILKNI